MQLHILRTWQAFTGSVGWLAMSTDLQARLELARTAAREAGALTLSYFRSPALDVELKADHSPVTIADRRAEELLRQHIGQRFAADAILGEEFGEQPGTSGYRWILDPIDGTKSFISGVPLYGTLVGVEYDDQPVIGVTFIPALDECVYAALGQGAWYQRAGAPPERARVSSRASLSDSLVCTSDTRFPTPARQEAFARVQNAARVSRTWGDCYGYLLVATGRAEVMIDPLMHVWDAAAVQPIVVEAGGSFTDWQGRPTIHGGEGIATNGRVLNDVLSLVRGA
ncbi:MAG TPA: histidinol-phosphatase [Pirellulales bacterium]|nr:histidinol-phosphatase [Pirellulales bacterium]